MSQCLQLLLATIQSLIYSCLLNESLSVIVKNPITIDTKKKSKPDEFTEIQQYRKIANESSKMEQIEIKKVAETLVMKSQKLPSKRFNENRGTEILKKNKREVIKVLNEEFPVYKTTKLIDEVSTAPIFSMEETMPKINLNKMVPKESKFYIEVEYRINKIQKCNFKNTRQSIQRILLERSQW